MKFLRDKRVDKILDEAGIKNAEVFYSPISVTLPHTIYILVFANISSLNWIVFTVTFLVALVNYMLVLYMNNSLAITDDFLFVINTNYPFKKIETIDWKSIQHIQIDCKKPTWLFLLLIFSSNSIQIKTTKEIRKYYCIGIEQDAFDENVVEKPIEEFEKRVIEKGIICDAKYSYL
jgi:hypothetical protein